jgi:hydrogenase expression/formation protein HypC
MCLGVPGRFLAMSPDGQTATVEMGGEVAEVSLAMLVADPPRDGDWLAVHMGFAMARMTEREAREALDALVVIGPGADAFDETALSEQWGLEEQGVSP